LEKPTNLCCIDRTRVKTWNWWLIMINGACKAWFCTNKFEVSQELHRTSGIRTVLTAQFDCIDRLVLWCLHLMSQSQTWLLTICWIKIKIQSSTSYEVRQLFKGIITFGDKLTCQLSSTVNFLLARLAW